MVYFGGKADTEIWELTEMDNTSFRLVIPADNGSYFILATCRIVQTNKGTLRKIESGEKVHYGRTTDDVIAKIKADDASRLDLIKSVCYEAY